METMCLRKMCIGGEFGNEKVFFKVFESFVRVHVPYDTISK